MLRILKEVVGQFAATESEPKKRLKTGVRKRTGSELALFGGEKGKEEKWDKSGALRAPSPPNNREEGGWDKGARCVPVLGGNNDIVPPDFRIATWDKGERAVEVEIPHDGGARGVIPPTPYQRLWAWPEPCGEGTPPGGKGTLIWSDLWCGWLAPPLPSHSHLPNLSLRVARTPIPLGGKDANLVRFVVRPADPLPYNGHTDLVLLGPGHILQLAARPELPHRLRRPVPRGAPVLVSHANSHEMYE